MDRVNLEVQQAERDYDLNRCVCVWGGGLGFRVRVWGGSGDCIAGPRGTVKLKVRQAEARESLPWIPPRIRGFSAWRGGPMLDGARRVVGPRRLRWGSGFSPVL